MSITIHDVRVTLVWTERLPGLPVDQPSIAAPLTSLGPMTSYISLFNKVRSGSGGGLLSVPWERPVGHNFWTYYLQGVAPGEVAAAEAWKAIVPFRHPLNLRAVGTGGNALTLEGFWYPHGLALAASTRLTSSSSLADTVVALQDISRYAPITITLEGGTTSTVPQGSFAATALTILREAGLGLAANPGMRSPTPFSITTVVQASGCDSQAPLTKGGELNRALEGLVSWRRTWPTDTLTPLSKALVGIRASSPPGHVMLAGDRGRVVWFPASFEPSPGQSRRSLGCYHRNLVLTSLHIESLCDLVSATTQQIDQGLWAQLPLACQERARQAAGILGRLYGGTTNTYRSGSAQRQISQPERLASINQLRDACNMPPLH